MVGQPGAGYALKAPRPAWPRAAGPTLATFHGPAAAITTAIPRPSRCPSHPGSVVGEFNAKFERLRGRRLRREEEVTEVRSKSSIVPERDDEEGDHPAARPFLFGAEMNSPPPPCSASASTPAITPPLRRKARQGRQSGRSRPVGGMRGPSNAPAGSCDFGNNEVGASGFGKGACRRSVEARSTWTLQDITTRRAVAWPPSFFVRRGEGLVTPVAP